MWKGWDPIGDPAVTLTGMTTNTTFNFNDVNKLTVLFFSDETENRPAFEAHFSSEIITTTSTAGTEGTTSEGTTGGSTSENSTEDTTEVSTSTAETTETTEVLTSPPETTATTEISTSSPTDTTTFE